MKELKEGENRELINHEHEIRAISKYIKENWSGWENIRTKSDDRPGLYEFISFVYYQGINDSKSWFDEHEIAYETIHEMEESRKEFLENTPFKEVYLYDTFHKTLSGLYYSFSDIKRAFTDYKFWNFSNQVEKTLGDARKFFNNLNSQNLGPINWADEQKKMNNKENFHQFREKIFNSFEGHNSSGIRSFNFPERLDFGNVQYDDEEQGRSKLTSLTSAIYSQALGISENNNTYKIKQILYEFNNDFKNSPINGKKIDTSTLKKHALTELALKVYENKMKEKEDKEYSHSELVQRVDEIKMKKEEWNKKTDEEKAVIEKQNEQRVANFIEELMNKMDNKEKSKEDNEHHFIRATFNEILSNNKQQKSRKIKP